MNLDHMLAQLRGTLPSDVLEPDTLPDDWPTCKLKRCHRPVAVKKDGTLAHACQRCLDRRAASCRRRRATLTAEGGCRRCAYRKRLEGDFLCQRCREERDIERAQKRQDAIDAAAIDEFAAQPERVHKASNLDRGISPWNARQQPPEPTAAYWSPLPDPSPKQSETWRWSLMNGPLHHRY